MTTAGVPGLVERPDVGAGEGAPPLGTDGGGRITVVDVGDAVVLLPPGGRAALLANALSAAQHLRHVAELDDPDLATT